MVDIKYSIILQKTQNNKVSNNKANKFYDYYYKKIIQIFFFV